MEMEWAAVAGVVLKLCVLAFFAYILFFTDPSKWDESAARYRFEDFVHKYPAHAEAIVTEWLRARKRD